jgi:hypothetical protein
MLLLTRAALVAADGPGKTTWFGLEPVVVVPALVGLIGGSGLVWKIVDLWRSRSRFSFHQPPTIDQASRVRVNIIQKGTTKGFIQYLDVVSVRSTAYRILRRIWGRPEPLRGGISVLKKRLVEGRSVPVESKEPVTFKGKVVECADLPVPWKPWKLFQNQAPRRQDLRVKANWGTKPASYTKLKYQEDYGDDRDEGDDRDDVPPGS